MTEGISARSKKAQRKRQQPSVQEAAEVSYDATLLADFKDMFTGNQQGYGVHTMSARNGWVHSMKKGGATAAAYKAHLNGTQGLGIAPTMAGDVCLFGCIDWDEHHVTKEDVDLVGIAEKVAVSKLPLVVCRSKGGGAHILAFFSEPVQASKCKALLTMFSQQLGISDTAEIFPKQTRVIEGQMGNTINLPYYECTNTERYAISNGMPQTFDQFMRQAASVALDAEQLNDMLGGEHAQAPPCLQHIITHGAVKGNRNEAMFNMSLYLRKRYPEDYRDKLYDLNASIFTTPLPMVELRRVISSTVKKDYLYRCQESPCKDFCNKEECLSREYGITPEDSANSAETMFCRLCKVKTDPVQWELGVGQHTIYTSTHVLMDYRKLMETVAERTTTLLPVMKNNEWWRILQDLMNHAEEIDAPQDSTVGGIFVMKLTEFIRRARIPSIDTPQAQSREGLLMSQPVLEFAPDDPNVMVAHFRAIDFMEALKRSRAGNITGSALWNTLRKHGVESGRVRVGKTVVAVWSVKVVMDDTQRIVPVFKTDF